MNGYVHSKNNLLPPDTLEIKMYLVSRVHCCLALHTVVNGLMFYLRQSFEISIPSLSVCGNASSFEVLSKLSLGPYLNLRAQLLDSWSDTSYLKQTRWWDIHIEIHIFYLFRDNVLGDGTDIVVLFGHLYHIVSFPTFDQKLNLTRNLRFGLQEEAENLYILPGI